MFRLATHVKYLADLGRADYVHFDDFYQEIGLDGSHKVVITALMNKNKSNGKNHNNFLEDEDRIRIVDYMFTE